MLARYKFGAAGAPFRPCSGAVPRSTSKRPHSLTIRKASDSDRAAANEQENPWSKPGYKGALVSQLPEQQQAAAFAAIAAGIAAGTVLCAGVAGPAVSAHLPSFLQVTSKSWFPLGPIFIAAGIAHFTEEGGFKAMYPHQGAWGFWSLPGSAKFHVQWTGVAEVLGGLGLCLGALPLDAVPQWLAPASALGLFALTVAVTPANIYMFTHNAPGPVPESVTTVVPPQGHAARGVLQMVLLSTLWGIATAAT